MQNLRNKRNTLQRSWRKIWPIIELMKGTLGISWRYIRKQILKFVYGSLTSIETSSRDEETKVGPSGIA
jgi:hypothetical protein